MRIVLYHFPDACNAHCTLCYGSLHSPKAESLTILRSLTNVHGNSQFFPLLARYSHISACRTDASSLT